jgi:Uma2 family endonuclease
MSTAAQPLPIEPRPVRWTKPQYLASLAQGPAALPPRTFLFRGELIEMPPMQEPHAQTLTRLSYWAIAAFRPGFEVRVQMPMDVPGDSVPEPDLLVCRPDQLRRDAPPSGGVLVVEVADSSVSLDRVKADDYAAAGIGEYWLVNLRARTLEVHRQPVPDATSPSGWRYGSVGTLGPDEPIAPLALPAASTRGRDLMVEA